MATTISRRNVLRAGVVGGALVWAVPAVQLLDPRHAFAASGSGTPPPPPGTRTPPERTIPVGTRKTGLPTSVLGETTSKVPPGSATTGTGTTVAASGSSSASGVLPFTGSKLPVKSAVEAGAGLVVGGAVLRTLAARRPQAAGEADATQAPPTD